MNKSICFAVFILLYISPEILGQKRVLEITRRGSNVSVPVWIDDHVEIVARNIFIFTWLFNNTPIAVLNQTLRNYTYPNSWLLPNITASPGDIDASLTLGNVNHNHTGLYEDENPNTFSLSMTVHGNNL